MIEMPRRSVTRFFIPLIDVLIVLFGIFLLMPMVRARGQGGEEAGADQAVTNLERHDLERLRQKEHEWIDVERLQREREELRKELDRLRQEKKSTLEQRLAVRVLEILEEGRLFYFDPRKAEDRKQEITRENVRLWIDAQKRQAEKKELYVLILYPLGASGFPGFPLLEQRREYDEWFKDVAHSYDVPQRAP